MKKVILFACVAMLTFASCGNKTAQSDASADTVVVDEQALGAAEQAIEALKADLSKGDQSKVKMALAQMQAAYAKLVEDGKLEEAKTYALALQEFIEENKDAINKVVNGETTIVELLNGVKNLPTSAETTAESALAAVTQDAKNIAAGVLQTGEEAKDAAIEEAKAKVNEKVSEAVAPAVQKAAEAKKAVDDAKAKADAAKAKVDEKAAQAKAVQDAAKQLLGK